MIGDLHCHTKISDGSMSIDDVVFYAKRAKMDFLAITDHDSFAGITRAAIVGKRLGIHIMPGVEISCMDKERNKKVHVLCYNPVYQDRLEGICNKNVEARNSSAEEMLKLVMKHYPVTQEHVMRYRAGSKALHKAHIMQALMDLGYANSIYGEEYVHLFSQKHGICRVTPDFPDVYDVMNTIKESKGVAVIAHPEIFDSLELASDLAKQGLLDGLEINHPTSTEDTKEKCKELAKEHGLILTGGSDFHGYYTANPRPIGSYTTDEENLLKLFALFKKKALL